MSNLADPIRLSVRDMTSNVTVCPAVPVNEYTSASPADPICPDTDAAPAARVRP